MRRNRAWAALAACFALTATAVAAVPQTPAGAATGAATVEPVGIPGTWTIGFDDEFTGTALNAANWSTGWGGAGITKGSNSNEYDCYDPAQVAVSGGTLNLTAIQKTETCGDNNQQQPYTTGAVTSDGLRSFTYGAFEARIYMPASSNGAVANWPAWWTDGQNWPTDGEMDIVEGLNGEACATFHSAAGAPSACAGYNYGGWHTYGADWEPGSVTWYYDGVQVYHLSTGITAQPMYLILDNAVGYYGGTISVPATMKVDYVRVWHH